MFYYFMLTGSLGTSKVKISKNCIWVTAMMAEHDRRATDVPCVFDLPKANVLLTARNKT